MGDAAVDDGIADFSFRTAPFDGGRHHVGSRSGSSGPDCHDRAGSGALD
jgi:hypothetical protein